MQDHWGKIHDDMRNIYEDIKSSDDSEDSKSGSGTLDSDSKVRVRQAIYDIRLKAKKEGKPLSKVYQEYIGRSSMSPSEKSLVKAKVMGASEEFIYHFDSIEFDEQSGNYKVKVTESATGKIFQRRMSLQKINELRHLSDSFVIEKKKDSTYLEPDMKKRQANNEKARKEMEKVPGQKNPHFEAADMSKEEVEVEEGYGAAPGSGEKAIARTKKYMEKKGMKGAPGLDAMAARKKEHEERRGVKKEGFSGILAAYHAVYDREEVEQVDEAGRMHSASSQQAGFQRIKDKESGGPGVSKVRSDDEIKKEKGGQAFLDKIAKAKAKMNKEEVEQVDENRAAMGRIAREYNRKKEAEEMEKRSKAPKDRKPLPKRKDDNPMYDVKSAGSSRVKDFKFTGEDYDPMDDPDFDHDEAEKNRGVSGKNNPKGGKAFGKKKKMKEGLDPVGKEDGDVDNDGDKDKSDKYLMKRRKAIGKAIAAKEEVESPFGDIKSMVKRAMKRVDADVDGDVDDKDRKSSNEMGEYVPTPDGKKKTTRVKEGYSWRDDLIEVMGDSMDDDTKKKIDVMKGKNKITVHGLNKEETSHEEPVEEVALQEDQSEKKYCKLCKKEETKSECTFGPKMWEKYSVDLAEDNGVEVDEAMMAGPRKDAMKKKEYSAKSGSDRAIAFNIGTRRDVSVSDPKIKSRGGRADKRTGQGVRRLGNAAKRRMGEEAEQPDKEMLAKKKQLMMKQQMLDKQRLQAQQQGKLPSGHRVEQNESMSAFEKVKAELQKKYGKNAIVGSPKKKVDHAKANAAKAYVRKPNKREQESSGRYTGGYAGD